MPKNAVLKNLRRASFLLALGTMGVRAQSPGDTTPAPHTVPVITLRGSINFGFGEHLKRVFEKARRDHAPAVLIEMDTPGGYLEATRDIVQLELNSDTPRVIVWVTPQGARAASAGSMIAMAAHYASMAPSTSIGAATPVTSTGSDIAKDMKNKVTNDTLSFVAGIADKRGRNGDWARQSIVDAASLSAPEAFRKGVVDGLDATRDDVWAGARKKFPDLPVQVNFTPAAWNWRENVLDFASDPNVAYGLMALGAMGIYVEISHPGLVVPGAVGAFSLALGAITMKILPIRPGAFVLLVLGLVLLAVEVLTPLPTFGVAGILAAGSIFLSGLFLMDEHETNLGLDPHVWIPIFLGALIFMAFIGYQAIRGWRVRPQGNGAQSLDDLPATVKKVVAPGRAKIAVRGEIWDAVWDVNEGQSFVEGQTVIVVTQRDMIARVKAPRIS